MRQKSMKNKNLQHVFIIGCKGIPASYGGFETFVDKLTQYQSDRSIRYHVACAAEQEEYDRAHAQYTYHHARCVTFVWRSIGPARAIAYDVEALRYFIRYAKRKRIPHPIFYVLACRIGPFIAGFRQKIDSLGGQLFVNPDGHEFLRAKWSAPIRRYWKFSERLMVKHANLLICDSQNIESYIQKTYAKYCPNTDYIAYGASTDPSGIAENDPKLQQWYEANGLCAKDYYLIVGRFVPENNYETMLREYMQSHTSKKLAIITDTAERFYQELQAKTHFELDGRICFTGTVYDQELLKKIRENAYGYLHGHEVGGTNPSLLEALASTDLNLLFDVGFNREVAQNGAYYWTKKPGSLAALLDQAEMMEPGEIAALGKKAHERIAVSYSWEFITNRYEQVFIRRNHKCVES